MEKSDHTLSRGQLQSTEIPTEKWKDVSLDFITDLPESLNNFDSILTVIDKATRMTHLIPCRKKITATETAQKFVDHIVRLHGVPRSIFTDRGTQFCSKFWQEMWKILGTSLKYSTAYHPQTQGIVERMNAVIGQMLRCTLSSLERTRDWDLCLPTIELAINSAPNRSTDRKSVV